ncbi:MAG: NADH-quinone oxidoreductase subunit C [Candidatus Gastranaerophilales bacterium]|nr:NADH-quinone oxidoreductase subunit C [Candidatus Gastranaerophilales bacterium]
MNFEITKKENSFDKIYIGSNELCELLKFLKNNPEYDFDRLNTIIAIDLDDKFEVIYDLHSTNTGQMRRISVLVDRNSPHVPSVVDIFKSAYFDECEIYDLFGITFDKNPDLKRLLMPRGWLGHPLRKDYKQEDERLSWSER